MKFKFQQDHLFMFFSFVFLSIVLIIFSDSKLFLNLRNVSQTPLIFLEEKIYKQKKKDLSQEELKEALRVLAVDANKLNLCLGENEHLKKLLGAPLPSSWHFVLAKVLNFSDWMIIDKGLEDGVSVGNMVVLENIFIGRISWVGKHEAKVAVLSGEFGKIPVLVKDSQGAVVGRGLVERKGEALILSRVLQKEMIKEEDLVVTSGDLGYKPDLLVGYVKELNKDKRNVFKEAVIFYPLEETMFDSVFVIVK